MTTRTAADIAADWRTEAAELERQAAALLKAEPPGTATIRLYARADQLRKDAVTIIRELSHGSA